MFTGVVASALPTEDTINVFGQEWEILEDNYKSIIPELYRWRNWALDNKDGKAMTGDELSNFIINHCFMVDCN